MNNQRQRYRRRHLHAHVRDNSGNENSARNPMVRKVLLQCCDENDNVEEAPVLEKSLSDQSQPLLSSSAASSSSSPFRTSNKLDNEFHRSTGFITTWRGLNAHRKLPLMKKSLTMAVASMVLICLFGSVHRIDVLRKLMGFTCSHSPYVKVGDVVGTIPQVIAPPDRQNPPSHIALCHAIIQAQDDEAQLSAQPEGEGNDNSEQQYVSLHVAEDEALCTDWSAPHFSIMSIFASSLLVASAQSYPTLEVSYRHNCHLHIDATHYHQELRYDYTPAQVLLPEYLISPSDASKIDAQGIRQLCLGCISAFDNTDPPSTRSGTTHHCLLYPGGDISHLLQTSHLALSSVLPSLSNRLQHMAEDWLHVSEPIDYESSTGAIIYIDDTSHMMHYDIYDTHIPHDTTSIQIFTTATCALAASNANNQNDCLEHGRRLKRFFYKNRFLKFGTFVRFDTVASTAAAYARMIHAKTLICPPGTISCLLPALAKIGGTTAVVAESSRVRSNYLWMDHLKEGVGIAGDPENQFSKILNNIVVVKLEADDESDLEMPLDVIGEDGDQVDRNSAVDFVDHVPYDSSATSNASYNGTATGAIDGAIDGASDVENNNNNNNIIDLENVSDGQNISDNDGTAPLTEFEEEQLMWELVQSRKVSGHDVSTPIHNFGRDPVHSLSLTADQLLKSLPSNSEEENVEVDSSWLPPIQQSN